MGNKFDQSFDATIKSLTDKFGELNKLANDIIPKEKMKGVIDGKPVEITVGLSGRMVSIVFDNENDVNNFIETIKVK